MRCTNFQHNRESFRYDVMKMSAAAQLASETRPLSFNPLIASP